MYNYPKTIQAAAKILDKAKPGWEKFINKGELSQNDVNHCILGQLYCDGRRSGYSNGMIMLFGNSDISQYTDTIFGSQASATTWLKEIDERLQSKKVGITFGAAMQALADGKKIRVVGWDDGSHYKLINNVIANSGGHTTGNIISPFQYKDEQWEVVPELTFKSLKKGDKFSTVLRPSLTYVKASNGQAILNGYDLVDIGKDMEVKLV